MPTNPPTQVPCLFLYAHEKDAQPTAGEQYLAIPEVRPGLEWILTGWKEYDDGKGKPVTAHELIDGEPGRELTTALGPEFSFTPFNFFQDVRSFLERYDPPVWGIQWRLGDTPVAQVTRAEMGMEL